MATRTSEAPDRPEGPVRRWLRYALYDWTREMPRSKRILVWAAIVCQGYAIWSALLGSMTWHRVWPESKPMLYLAIGLLYLFGERLMNAVLTSEMVRKSHLESEQVAARRIQKTLLPETLDDLPGYQTALYFKPFRAVGGDYFDVIDLPEGRTLFALADVSGKGMAAALLAANIQALVRSLSTADADPLALVTRIDEHLLRYTPSNRYATAVILVLTRATGELTYVNAGHNPPLLCGAGAPRPLDATGVPMGLLPGTRYSAASVMVPPGGMLLLFTDGLPDAVSGDDPDAAIRAATTDDPHDTMARLQALIHPRVNEDDVTILLVKRGQDGHREELVTSA